MSRVRVEFCGKGLQGENKEVQVASGSFFKGGNKEIDEWATSKSFHLAVLSKCVGKQTEVVECNAQWSRISAVPQKYFSGVTRKSARGGIFRGGVEIM